MKIPLSKRLACCAGMISPGARVADIGTDHGYLPIFLAKNQLCASIFGADLREKPLQKAVENATLFGVADAIQFRLSDGLAAFDGSEMDTVVCAGMGGDLIVHILSQAPWLKNPQYRLILQPQSSGHELRRWLAENSFAIEQEQLLREGGFFYTVLLATYGNPAPLTPGQQFLSPALLQTQSDLLPQQMQRLLSSIEKTITGIENARGQIDLEKLTYYKTAYAQLQQMREENDCCK